jgi:HK97 family phage portal protein
MPDDNDGISYKAKVILHFKLEDPDDDFHGLSLLASLQHTIANDLFAIEYNGKFFENSAQTGIVFNMSGASTDEVERNRTWLEQNYVGAANAHRPLILEGDIKVERAGSSPAEMQFLEGRIFNRQEILSVLDIPPEKLQINGSSNRSTGKESDNTFRSESLAGWQSIIEEEINNRLILELFGWDDTVFRFREASKRDLIEMTKSLAELSRMGVYSVNEIRGDFGFANVKGGDVHAIQSAAGVIPLEMI